MSDKYTAYELQSFDYKSIAKTERTIPKPQGHQVLIRVKAVSLNFRELLVARGHYSKAIKTPLVPCSDGAGEIVAVGENTKKFKVGDRVMPNFMPDWHGGPPTLDGARTALGAFVDGMLQQYVVMDEASLVYIPEHLSYQEAATLPCAAVTAWNALFEKGDLQPGQTVLVQGTGGVSIFALQFAKMAGATVIATSSSDDKLARLKDMGADHLINYKTTEKWDAEVLKVTGGQGVDLVIEVGGAGTLEKSTNAVKFGGTICVIGVLSGAGGGVSPINLIMRSIDMKGIFVGSRTMFEAMNRAITNHKMRPVIDKTFEADQIIAALQHLESGAHFGKIVVNL